MPDHKSLYNFDGADFAASETIRRRAEDEDNLDNLSSPSTRPGGKRCPSKAKALELPHSCGAKEVCGRAEVVTDIEAVGDEISHYNMRGGIARQYFNCI